MTELSPAAQAVMAAMHRSYDHETTRRMLAAAVLRAAADQVVPKQSREPHGTAFRWGAWAGRENTRRDLLAIAAELEGGHG